jgi:hypothetical protein
VVILRALQPLRYRLDVHTATALVEALAPADVPVDVWDQALCDARPVLVRSPAHVAWLASASAAATWGMCERSATRPVNTISTVFAAEATRRHRLHAVLGTTLEEPAPALPVVMAYGSRAQWMAVLALV